MSWCVSIDPAGTYFLRIWSFYIVFLFPSDTCMLSESLNSVRPHPKQMSSFSKKTQIDCNEMSPTARQLFCVSLSSSWVSLSSSWSCSSQSFVPSVSCLLNPCCHLTIWAGKEGVSWPTTTAAQKEGKQEHPEKAPSPPLTLGNWPTLQKFSLNL